MMKKIQLLLSLFMATLLLAGCSNSDSNDGSTDKGYAIFFHAISGADVLDLNGDDRDYGSVSYESFSTGISLEAKTWDLEVVNPDPEDSSADVTILDTSFSVVSDERRIFALSGDLASPKLHRLALAEDTEADGDDGEDENNIYLNVSHIDPEVGAVSVYFLDATESAEFDASSILPAVADATLSYGDTSSDLIFDDDNQRVVIVNSDPSVVFDSGDKDLNDALYQTLLITDYVGVDQQHVVSMHYYGLGGVDGLFHKTWRDVSSAAAVGYLRVINLLKDMDMTPPALTVDVSVEDAAAVEQASSPGLAYANSTGYFALDAGAYKVLLNVTGTTTYNVLVESGVAKTLYFYGRVESSTINEDESPKLVIDDKRVLDSNAKLSFVDLWYQEDEEDLIDLNVHLVKSGSTPDETTEVLSDVVFGSVSNATVADDLGYNLEVTNTNNITSYAWTPLPLNQGEVKQVVVYEGETGGAAVKDVTEDVVP